MSSSMNIEWLIISYAEMNRKSVILLTTTSLLQYVMTGMTHDMKASLASTSC